jgi:hypothetical protein
MLSGRYTYADDDLVIDRDAYVDRVDDATGAWVDARVWNGFAAIDEERTRFDFKHAKRRRLDRVHGLQGGRASATVSQCNRQSKTG